MSRKLIIALVVMVVVALPLFLSFSSDASGSFESNHVSVLDRQALPTDSLSSEFLAQPSTQYFADPGGGGSRLALVDGARSYYVLPGDSTKAGNLCLVFSAGSGDTFDAGGTCGPDETLYTGMIYVSELNPDGSLTVSGLVSDSVTEASAPDSARVPIINNVFVLHTNTTSITLTASSGNETVDIGQQQEPAEPAA